MCKTRTCSKKVLTFLNCLGTSNLYILWIWILMGVVWGLAAMPMIVSAFLTNEECLANLTCIAVNGSVIAEVFHKKK